MKKVLKWGLIGFVGLLFVFIVGSIVLTKSGYTDKKINEFKAKGARINGKLLASALKISLQSEFIESEKYPDEARLKELAAEISSGSKDYTFGLASDPEVASFCPDCHLSEDSFKIAIYGNLDEDPDLDVITIDSEGKMLLIQDDLGLEDVPMDMSPKAEG